MERAYFTWTQKSPIVRTPFDCVCRVAEQQLNTFLIKIIYITKSQDKKFYTQNSKKYEYIVDFDPLQNALNNVSFLLSKRQNKFVSQGKGNELGI